MEQIVSKFFLTWKRLGGTWDRLYVDTGASNPHLRSMLNSLESLTNDTLEVQLDDGGDRTIRLKVLRDDRD